MEVWLSLPKLCSIWLRRLRTRGGRRGRGGLLESGHWGRNCERKKGDVPSVHFAPPVTVVKSLDRRQLSEEGGKPGVAPLPPSSPPQSSPTPSFLLPFLLQEKGGEDKLSYRKWTWIFSKTFSLSSFSVPELALAREGAAEDGGASNQT